MAKAYYDHMRNDQNAEHDVAVRSLAFKWIRIIYRCWKDGKPHDEEAYMETLRRRGSPPGRSSGISHQYRVEDHRRIFRNFLKKPLDGITQKDSESRMREMRLSGSMSGVWKRAGWG